MRVWILVFSIVLVVEAHTQPLRAGDRLPLTSEERAPRLERILHGVLQSAAGLDRALARPNPTPTPRDLSNAALACLLAHDDPKEAEKLVDLAFSQQLMDEHDADYGMVPWQNNIPNMSDKNAIEFAAQATGPMLLTFGQQLSPEFKARLTPHLRAAIAAMNHRKLAVAYTNIWLMRATDMVLLGQALGDAQVTETGYAQLDQWIDFTRRGGVSEFNSPTYTAVDISDAALGYRYAADPRGRLKFKAVLDYLWTDVAAHWFAPADALGGANSRNYSFLDNAGGIDYYAYAEGLRPDLDIGRSDLEKVDLVAALDEKGYHPDQKILALADLPTRTVHADFIPDSPRDRYTFVTPDFCLGSAGGFYGQQDKLLSIQLASPKPLPVMAIIPDRFDSPYGQVKTPDSTGHHKPTHLKYQPTFVQDHGAVLAMIDLDLSREKGDSATISTNLLAPIAVAELRLDDKPAPAHGAFELSGHDQSILLVRGPTSAVAVKVFGAVDAEGHPAEVSLRADEEGIRLGVARLLIRHYRGSERPISKTKAHVGLLIVCAECRSDAQWTAIERRIRESNIEQSVKGDRWTASATIDSSPVLAAVHDLRHHTPVERTIDGKPIEPVHLSVNGQDLGQDIWRRLDAALTK